MAKDDSSLFISCMVDSSIIVRVLILKMISLSKYYKNPTELLQEINDGLIKTDLRNDIMDNSNELFSICSKFIPPSKF